MASIKSSHSIIISNKLKLQAFQHREKNERKKGGPQKSIEVNNKPINILRQLIKKINIFDQQIDEEISYYMQSCTKKAEGRK